MDFRSIDDVSELDLFVSLSAKRAVSAQWVTGLLERGESRSEWCRMVFSPGGDLLAAHVLDSWSPDGEPGPAPTFVQLLGHADEAAAASLLAHDLRSFGAESVDARVIVAVDAAPDLRMLRESQPRVLQAAGFALKVDRVRIEWLPTSSVPRPTGVLRFRPAATVADDDLVEMFAEVGDGSLDNGMISTRAECGRAEEAARRVRHARKRRHEDDWFVVGVDSSGVPVGYVQSAMDSDEHAILAEIGVVAPQRGQGHVDELLAYGTAVLADSGVPRIGSDTDVANRPMRAAFARAGYVEFASRRDYHWRAAT